MAGEVTAREIEVDDDFNEVSKMLRKFHQKKNKNPEDIEAINDCLKKHGLSTRY